MVADALYATPACTPTVISRFIMTHAGENSISVPAVAIFKINQDVRFKSKKIYRTLEISLVLFRKIVNIFLLQTFFGGKVRLPNCLKRRIFADLLENQNNSQTKLSTLLLNNTYSYDETVNIVF